MVGTRGANSNNRGLKVRFLIQSNDKNGSFDGDDDSDNVNRVEKMRVTRSKRGGIKVSDSAAGDFDFDAAEEEEVEELKNIRATRSSKNKRNIVEICDSNVGNLEDLEQEQKKIRVTRNLKNKQKKLRIYESGAIGDLDDVKERVEEPKNSRVIRNSKKKGIVVIEENSSVVDGMENVEKKKRRGDAKGKKKLHEEFVSDGDGKENCDEKETDNVNANASWPDSEKTSVGQLFDFMEVYLSKQIIDETEEIVDSMRQKAERLREYVITHENQNA